MPYVIKAGKVVIVTFPISTTRATLPLSGPYSISSIFKARVLPQDSYFTRLLLATPNLAPTLAEAFQELGK